jgi:protein phosphatase
MNVRIEWGAFSDRGRVRSRNEDHHVVWVSEDETSPVRALFVVADGMGGHPGGHEASRLAAEEMEHVITGMKDVPPSIEDALAEAFQTAHSRIREEGRREPNLEGMGTTLTTLLVTAEKIFGGHVGDSRLYEFRRVSGELVMKLRTTDHTVAREQSDAGIISPSKVEDHPLSHVLTRSVGAGEAPGVDVLDLGSGMREERTFLLCTDGLVRVVNEDEIPYIVDDEPLPEAAQALVDLANARGAPDNVTVILARVLPAESQS